MNLKAKILLLAILPLLIAAGVLSVLGYNHTNNLANQVLEVYEFNLTEARKQALEEHMDQADSAIRHLMNDPELSESEAKEAVRGLLTSLKFGTDGYFFAYTREGINIVHPTIPEFVGEDLYQYQDRNGNYLIQHLLAAAESGGDFHRYVWARPPDMQQEDKLGYADMIEPWGWMYGTGLYLDSITEEVAKVKASFDDNIRNSFITVMAVILVTVLLIVLLGVGINLHEHRLADGRLQNLIRKFLRLQVNERRQFSRELHDGINQQLVSLKLRIELAEKKLSQADEQHSAARDLDIASDILNDTIQEVRQISHNLRPVLLDDLGLEPALRALADQFSEHTGIQVDLDYGLDPVAVSDDVETTLYRVTQESLNNIKKHARASQARIHLGYHSGRIELEVSDNGRGFDTTTPRHQGIGLMNMRERVEVIGGMLNVNAQHGQGTRINAWVPYRSEHEPQRPHPYHPGR